MTEAQHNEMAKSRERLTLHMAAPASEVVIPPAPPMPKPELVGAMPPLKWRKKFLKGKLRRQGKNRITRRSRTL